MAAESMSGAMIPPKWKRNGGLRESNPLLVSFSLRSHLFFHNVL